MSSPLLTNLTSYWKMDESGGTFLDHHGTNHFLSTNGTINNTSDALIGNAASFVTPEVGPYLRSTSNPSLNTTVSYMFWFKTENPNIRLGALGGGTLNLGSFNMYLSNGIFHIFFRGLGAFRSWGTTSLADNQWHQIIVTRPGGSYSSFNINVYIDKVLTVQNGANLTSLFVSSNLIYVGQIYVSAVLMGTIQFDEIALWRGRHLPQEEVDLLYNNGAGLAYPFTPQTEPLFVRKNGVFVPVSRGIKSGSSFISTTTLIKKEGIWS